MKVVLDHFMHVQFVLLSCSILIYLPVRVKANETVHAMVAGAKRNVGDDKMDYQLPIAR